MFQTLVTDLVITPTLLRAILISVIIFLLLKLYQSRGPSLPLPPGPLGIPVLGFLPFVSKNFHLTLTQLSQKYGSCYQIFLGSKRIVVLSDARLIKDAFRQPVFSGRPDSELTRILQGYGKFSRILIVRLFQFFY